MLEDNDPIPDTPPEPDLQRETHTVASVSDENLTECRAVYVDCDEDDTLTITHGSSEIILVSRGVSLEFLRKMALLYETVKGD